MLMLAWDSSWVLAVAWVLSMVVAITLHELAHAATAHALGDGTARRLGRLTLAPWAHMSPWALLSTAVLGAGWGSTPLRPRRLRSRHALALVALAGPAANLLLAALAMTATGAAQGVLRDGLPDGVGTATFEALVTLGAVNILVALLNLLPLPMLDGWLALGAFWPRLREVARRDDARLVTLAVLTALCATEPLYDLMGACLEALVAPWTA